MRLRYVLPGQQQWNPEFNQAEAAAAHKAGKPYFIKPTITRPVGFEFDVTDEHDKKHSWILVDRGICEPVDDEAIEATKHIPQERILRNRADQIKLDKGMATGNPLYDNEPEQDDHGDADDGTALSELDHETY